MKGDRIKRQTCRHGAVRPGASLHVWWGNPRNSGTKAVRKIGVVAVAACRALEIDSAGPGLLAVLRCSGGWGRWPAAEFARADGFADVAAAQRFFLPKPGTWRGFVWEW